MPFLMLGRSFLIVFGSLEREIVEILPILKWMGGFLMVCGAFFAVSAGQNNAE